MKTSSSQLCVVILSALLLTLPVIAAQQEVAPEPIVDTPVRVKTQQGAIHDRKHHATRVQRASKADGPPAKTNGQRAGKTALPDNVSR